MSIKVPQKHELVNKFVKGLLRGNIHSFLLIGKGGIGKTESVLGTLAKLGLKERTHFSYLNTHCSPKRFFQILEETNTLKNPKLLLLDDFDLVLKNPIIVGMLRSALWGDLNGKRKVSWYSTTTQNNEEFYFNGKIMFLLNDIQVKNPLIKALISRGFYYHLNLSNPEILTLMEKRIKIPYKGLEFKQRQKVYQCIAKNWADSQKLTLRSLEIGYTLFKSSPNHYTHLLNEVLK